MKETFFNWLTIVLIATVCGGMTACGGDDEDNFSGGSNGSEGGNGSSTVNVNGSSYAMGYGYWDCRKGTLDLAFSNIDMYNMEAMMASKPTRMQNMTLSIANYAQTTVSSGTYKAYMNFWDMNYNWSTQARSYNDELFADVEVTITLNGNMYTISISETTVNVHKTDEEGYDRVTGTASFSFNYSGQLTYHNFKDDE